MRLHEFLPLWLELEAELGRFLFERRPIFFGVTFEVVRRGLASSLEDD